MIALPNKEDTKSPSYPPVDDFINFVKGINWISVGSRLRTGAGALLLFAMSFSEKSYDFHEYLYSKVVYKMK